MRKGLLIILSIFAFDSLAQFAPAAGQPGSTAIHKDSSAFKAWATACSLQLGWQDISDTSLGRANTGSASAAIGRAGENGVVSLGDGGVATLELEQAIYNGDGWDFAVFENGFTDSFLELAFVEVSTDGHRFVRFPANSLTQTDTPVGGFGALRCENINNFAGKYRANFGTPFDLEELTDSLGIDISNIRFVRLIDVVGSIDDAFASYDSKGNKINDPFPTPFPQSGFDLDAVGAINVVEKTGISDVSNTTIAIYPNPSSGELFFEKEIEEGVLRDMQGKIVLVFSGDFADVSALQNGLYFLQVQTKETFIQRKIIVSK